MRTFLAVILVGMFLIFSANVATAATRLPTLVVVDPSLKASAALYEHHAIAGELFGKFNVLPAGTPISKGDYYMVAYDLELQTAGKGGGTGFTLPIPIGHGNILLLPVALQSDKVVQMVRGPVDIYKNGDTPELYFTTKRDFPGAQPIAWDHVTQMGSFYQYGWGFSTFSLVDAIRQATKASLEGIPTPAPVAIEEAVPPRPVVVNTSQQTTTTASAVRPRVVQVDSHSVKIWIPADEASRLAIRVRMAKAGRQQTTTYQPPQWKHEGAEWSTVQWHPGQAECPRPLALEILWDGQVVGKATVQP